MLHRDSANHSTSRQGTHSQGDFSFYRSHFGVNFRGIEGLFCVFRSCQPRFYYQFTDVNFLFTFAVAVNVKSSRPRTITNWYVSKLRASLLLIYSTVVGRRRQDHFLFLIFFGSFRGQCVVCSFSFSRGRVCPSFSTLVNYCERGCFSE